MDIEVRPIAPDEFEGFVRATVASFGATFRPEELERNRIEFEPGRSLAAYEAGAIVGTTSGVSFDLTVPGGFLPSLAVTGVGVLPTHRRRGVLRALMRRQLDEAREAGTPLAILWASEAAIYPRFGYGLAALLGDLDVDTRHSRYGVPFIAEGRMRLLSEEEALKSFPEVYERVRETQPGFLSRTPEWWSYRFWIPAHHRGELSENLYALYEEEGPRGYVVYRTKHHWPEGSPEGTLEVQELVAATDSAYAALWRYCFDHDLMTTVKAESRPSFEPLLHMMEEPRRLKLRLADALWVRVLDVRSALEGRRYRWPGHLVLGIRDEFCPWNEGRFELEVSREGASCRPTRSQPDLVLGAADLGALYLGGIPAWTLVRAGRIDEERAGAAEEADAMFAWTPPPWCPHRF
jgi:predicted acetyltransferase